jgi:hypothetical protein
MPPVVKRHKKNRSITAQKIKRIDSGQAGMTTLRTLIRALLYKKPVRVGGVRSTFFMGNLKYVDQTLIVQRMGIILPLLILMKLRPGGL